MSGSQESRVRSPEGLSKQGSRKSLVSSSDFSLVALLTALFLDIDGPMVTLIFSQVVPTLRLRVAHLVDAFLIAAIVRKRRVARVTGFELSLVVVWLFFFDYLLSQSQSTH